MLNYWNAFQKPAATILKNKKKKEKKRRAAIDLHCHKHWLSVAGSFRSWNRAKCGVNWFYCINFLIKPLVWKPYSVFTPKQGLRTDDNDDMIWVLGLLFSRIHWYIVWNNSSEFHHELFYYILTWTHEILLTSSSVCFSLTLNMRGVNICFSKQNQVRKRSPEMKKVGKCNRWKANTLTSYGGQWILSLVSFSFLTLCVFSPPLHARSPIHTPPTLVCVDWETFLWLLLNCSSCSFSIQRKKGPAVLVSGFGRSSTDEVLRLSRDNRLWALQQCGARPKHKAVIKEGPLLVSSTKWGQTFSTCVPSRALDMALFTIQGWGKGRHKDTVLHLSLSVALKH